MRIILLSLAFLIFSGEALTHSSHAHKPKDKCKAKATKDLKKSAFTVGKCHIKRFINIGKLEKSWSSSKPKESKALSKTKEWLVTFENPKAKKDKTLYIFLNNKGGFIAANFTGK